MPEDIQLTTAVIDKLEQTYQVMAKAQLIKGQPEPTYTQMLTNVLDYVQHHAMATPAKQQDFAAGQAAGLAQATEEQAAVDQERAYMGMWDQVYPFRRSTAHETFLPEQLVALDAMLFITKASGKKRSQVEIRQFGDWVYCPSAEIYYQISKLTGRPSQSLVYRFCRQIQIDYFPTQSEKDR